MSTAAPPGAKPPDRLEDAESVIATLTAAGHVAVLAGGCVRDQLLGLEPKDFDVATDAAPDVIRRLFRQTQAVGAAFGVMLVRMGQSTIEVARFRSDGTYLDGRHPSSVTFATPKEDAQRRDFTINGLFYDVARRAVIDYVGGEADLRAGVLRRLAIRLNALPRIICGCCARFGSRHGSDSKLTRQRRTRWRRPRRN